MSRSITHGSKEKVEACEILGNIILGKVKKLQNSCDDRTIFELDKLIQIERDLSSQ